MFKKSILPSIVLPLLLISSPSAFATVILDFSPSVQTVPLSGQASVDITASNLQSEYIGAFDFDISWDSSILSLASVSFGNALGGGLLSFQAENTNNSMGTSSLTELSFLSNLTSLQTGNTNIILATLIFDTLSTGQSALALAGNISGGGFLSDENGNLLAASANSGLINVVTVSAPETLFLMGIGLLMIFGIRRRNESDDNSVSQHYL